MKLHLPSTGCLPSSVFLQSVNVSVEKRSRSKNLNSLNLSNLFHQNRFRLKKSKPALGLKMENNKYPIEGSFKPVTNCDQLKSEQKTELSSSKETFLSQYDIEKMILTVRDEQVLIDKDLAILFGVTTKALNQAVKRNIQRFPERYRFQLTKDETSELVTNCDRFKSLKHSSSMPYAFTEFGVSMLPSVLSTQEAIYTSIRIIDAFVAMRRFMTQNAGIIMRISHLERHQTETDEKIEQILDNIERRTPKLIPEQIFQT